MKNFDIINFLNLDFFAYNTPDTSNFYIYMNRKMTQIQFNLL